LIKVWLGLQIPGLEGTPATVPKVVPLYGQVVYNGIP